MSRNFSMAFKAVSGTVLSLAITFTLIIWGRLMWVFWDENIQVWWCSPPRHLARHKWLLVDSGMVLGQHGHPLDWKLPPAVLKVFLRILLIAFGIRVFSCLYCCVCGSGPTLGTNIVCLTRSLVTTAGTNTRNTALRIVHTDLFYIFTKVHQQ